MIQIRLMNCCGLREISSLASYTKKPRKALFDVLMSSTHTRYGLTGRLLLTRNPHRFGMFVFTQASDEENPDYTRAYGDQLKRIVERLKLGTVTVVGPFRNPNTGNYVRTYNWVVDWDAALKFLHQELRKKRKK